MYAVRWIALLVLVLFTRYTVQCARRESLSRAASTIFALRWGRQVTMDLYIGLFIFDFFVYLHQGSLLVAVFWLLPTLVLGNIVPLIYLVWNFDALARVLGGIS